MKIKHLIIIFLIIVLMIIAGFTTYMYIDIQEELKQVIIERENLNEQLNKVQLTNENLENKIIELEDSISNLEKKLIDNDIKEDVEDEVYTEVTSVYYKYDYVEIVGEGTDEEWELELVMGFMLNSDGTVWGFLPGHETGNLVGTYTNNDNEIKCDFTEYESESGGVSGIKLDKKGSVILKKINETEISVEKWIQKPELEGNDLSYGEDVIFSKM